MYEAHRRALSSPFMLGSCIFGSRERRSLLPGAASRSRPSHYCTITLTTIANMKPTFPSNPIMSHESGEENHNRGLVVVPRVWCPHIVLATLEVIVLRAIRITPLPAKIQSPTELSDVPGRRQGRRNLFTCSGDGHSPSPRGGRACWVPDHANTFELCQICLVCL